LLIGESLFFQVKVPCEQRIDPGGIKTSDGITGRTHERVAKQIETGVVQHRQPSLSSRFGQQRVK
jgi:hypothetical protein